MPDFDSHIAQAKNNLAFLQGINGHLSDHLDWQVTVSFYVAVHLVNAHLSKSNLQYRTHSAVDNILSPCSTLVNIRLPDKEYIAYNTLQVLSRRSRYLVNSKDGNIGSEKPAFTYDKHLNKALRHLETIILYFSNKYSLDISPIKMKETGLNGGDAHKYVIPV